MTAHDSEANSLMILAQVCTAQQSQSLLRWMEARRETLASQKKMRKRRTREEIEAAGEGPSFHCDFPGCTKHYTERDYLVRHKQIAHNIYHYTQKKRRLVPYPATRHTHYHQQAYPVSMSCR